MELFVFNHRLGRLQGSRARDRETERVQEAQRGRDRSSGISGMRDRIRSGHPLSGTLSPDLSRPLSPPRTKVFPTLSLIWFLLCSIFRANPERGFRHGKHHERPARSAQADRLCAVARPAQLNAPALGGSARPVIFERLDRGSDPAEAGIGYGPAAHVQAGGLR